MGLSYKLYKTLYFQVEEEFQLKREREKKRLKQQLKIYQAMQNGEHENVMDSPTYSRNIPLNYPDEASESQNKVDGIDQYGEYNNEHQITNKPNNKSIDQSYELSNGYQSTKVDYHSDNSRSYSNDSSKEYSSNGDNYVPSTDNYPRKSYHYRGSGKEDVVEPVLRVVVRDDRLSNRRHFNGDDTHSSTGLHL